MFKKIKKEYFFLSLILIFGFIVRLYKIGNPVADWHSWRQADTASVTKIYLEKGIDILRPRYHDISSIQTGIFNPEGYRMVEFPIYNAMVALSVHFLPFFPVEIWSRLITIFSSLIAAFFLYLLGKKYGSWQLGVLSAFFYLFLPFNIYFTRVILPDPIGVTFAVSALYFFDTKKLLFSILFSMALLIKPYFVFYLLPFTSEIIKKKNLKFIFLAFIPFVLWRGWISQFPEGIPFYKWAFNGDRIRFHFAFFKWIFWERLGVLILGIFGLLPFLSSFVKNNRNKFISSFLLGMFLYVSVVATANVRHDYYQILIIPAVSLPLAQGLLWLWKQSKFSILIIPIMFWVSWQKVLPFYQINHPEIVKIGHEVDQITPKDALIVAPYNGDTAFLYQTGRSGWPAVDDSIDNIIKKGADYFVSLDLNSNDTQNFSKMFETVKKTDQYVILDLHKKLSTKVSI